MAENNNHFGLRLDTEGPDLTIIGYSPIQGAGGNSTYYGSDVNSVSMTVMVEDRDGTTACYYRYYVDSNETASDASAPTTWSALTSSAVTVSAPYHATTFEKDGDSYTVSACVNYIHFQAMDDVGNKSEWRTSKKIIIDHTNPVVYTGEGDYATSIDHNTILTNKTADHAFYSRTGYFDPNYDAWDYKTPIKSVTITGDFTSSPINKNYLITLKTYQTNDTDDITLTAGDGWKYGTVTVTNWAGNTGTYTLNKADMTAIELDQTGAEIHAGIVNKKADSTYELVDSPTNKTGLAAAVEVTLDSQGKHDIKSVVVTVDGVTAGNTPTITGTEPIIYVDNLNIAEGTHTIVIVATDSAENQTTETITGFVVDRTMPTVDINLDPNDEGYVDATGKLWFSGQTNIKFVVSTSSSIAGFKEGYIDTRSQYEITTLTADVTAQQYLLPTSGLDENNEDAVQVTVTDLAGNTADPQTTQTAVSRIFYIDKTAPELTLVSPNATALNGWFNEKFPISVGYAESGSGVASMEAWVSDVAIDTAVPTGTTKVTSFAGSPVELSTATINYAGLKQSTTNYLHVKAVDNVGNISYIHQVFKYDDKIDDGTITTSTPIIASTTAGRVTIGFTASSASGADLSGYKYYMLTGDITNAAVWTELTAAEISAGKKENIAVTVTEGDGTKIVGVTLKDNAGNITAHTPVTSMTLDTVHPAGEIKLLNVAGGKYSDPHKDDPSSIPVVNICLRELVDTAEDYVEYKIWGDFGAIASTEAEAEWIRFGASDLTKLHSTDGLIYGPYTCTDNAGTEPERKYVYVKFRDDTGIESPTVNDYFTYDPVVAEITVSDVDYQVVSKVTSARRNSDGTEKSGTQCDTMTFKFSANKTIVAWKVCAYVRQADAESGSHLDMAIPTTNGSLNMSGTTTVAADTKVSCTIKGADYETCLEANVQVNNDLNNLGKNTDGIHYVVVYGQNEAGDWSSAAIFA